MQHGYIKTHIMEHLQSFDKGMVQDFADQPGGTFFEASAFVLISKSGNTFALESPKGNKYIFSLTKDYSPLGAVGQLDKIVVFSVNQQNQSEVGLVTSVEQETFSYEPIYNDSLDFSVNFPIEHIGPIVTLRQRRLIYLTADFQQLFQQELRCQLEVTWQ